MQVLVDADSCPAPARKVIIHAAKKRGVDAVFVANRPIPLGGEARMEVCPAQPGAADDRLVALAQAGDLVITRDVPLAARLVEKNAAVLDDRGRVYTLDNIREYLSVRDWTVERAEAGFDFPRARARGKKEHKAFSDSFDRLLTRLLRTPGTLKSP